MEFLFLERTRQVVSVLLRLSCSRKEPKAGQLSYSLTPKDDLSMARLRHNGEAMRECLWCCCLPGCICSINKYRTLVVRVDILAPSIKTQTFGISKKKRRRRKQALFNIFF